MNDKRIVIHITPQAVVTTEAFGYTGGACMKPLELIANALGSTTHMEAKPEYFEAEQQLQINA